MENKNLNELLFDAAGKNDLEQAKLLIKKGADLNAKNKWGDTPLHEAAMNNSVKVAKLLIKKGADLNDKNKWGDTPLLYAVRYDYDSVEVAELLKKHGGE